MEIDTIFIQTEWAGERESIACLNAAHDLNLKVCWGDLSKIDKSKTVPVGSVEFCEDWLGYHPIPNFAPWWLYDWRKRFMCLTEANYISMLDIPLFIKSAEAYKRFTAKIINPKTDLIPDGLLLASHVVQFVQEWRYYVADGIILATGWYDGNDENEPAPELNINWPKGFHGAVDFGRLSTGEIALVESHHPYACGWYGDDSAAFTLWLVEGWKYMLSLLH